MTSQGMPYSIINSAVVYQTFTISIQRAIGIRMEQLIRLPPPTFFLWRMADIQVGGSPDLETDIAPQDDWL